MTDEDGRNVINAARLANALHFGMDENVQRALAHVLNYNEEQLAVDILAFWHVACILENAMIQEESDEKDDYFPLS